MASVKRNSASSLNFRSKIQPENQRFESRGSIPLPSPVTIKEAFGTLIINILRKILFVNTNIKVGVYLGCLFLSFIFDFFPFPKSYLSRSDNVINLYFVKIGWFWTLVLTVPFVFLTSSVYCYGKKKLIFIHLSRLLIATVVWFVFTNSFAFIEQNLGKCSFEPNKKIGKRNCLSKGNSWNSLDISGHTFILIWSTLVITEEARAIIGWSNLQHLIIHEEHLRASKTVSNLSILRKLTDKEFEVLSKSYDQYDIYVKGLFVALTILTIIWDLMVVSTILYFHIMVEKLISGILAVFMWFVTYKYWYPKLKIPPTLPGEGPFNYSKARVRVEKLDDSYLSKPVTSYSTDADKAKPSEFYVSDSELLSKFKLSQNRYSLPEKSTQESTGNLSYYNLRSGMIPKNKTA